VLGGYKKIFVPQPPPFFGGEKRTKGKKRFLGGRGEKKLLCVLRKRNPRCSPTKRGGERGKKGEKKGAPFKNPFF